MKQFHILYKYKNNLTLLKLTIGMDEEIVDETPHAETLNYTLYLTYIITNNVLHIQNIDDEYLIVTPKVPDDDILYKKAISTFSSFITFNEEVELLNQEYYFAFRFYVDFFTNRRFDLLVLDYNCLVEFELLPYDFTMFMSNSIGRLENNNLCDVNFKIACEMYRLGNYKLCRNILNDAIRAARLNYNVKGLEKAMRYLNKM